jgi:hypothetical protein
MPKPTGAAHGRGKEGAGYEVEALAER